LFGGYNRYHFAPSLWRWLSALPGPVRALASASLTALPAEVVNRFSGFLGIAQPGDKAHKLGQKMRNLGSIDDLYIGLISEWSNARQIVPGAVPPATILDHRHDWPRIDNPAERMMLLDSLTYLPDDILVKVDRASMAVSLENRAPFLDRNVVEFAWRLPVDMKLRDGKNKYLLRQLLKQYVPEKLFARPKMGFGIPLDQWLRGPLRDWAEELLGERRIKREGYLNPVPVREAWSRHLSGRQNYGYRLWSVLMFQLWLERQQRL